MCPAHVQITNKSHQFFKTLASLSNGKIPREWIRIKRNKINSLGLLMEHNSPPVWREKRSKCPSGCPSKGIGDEKMKINTILQPGVTLQLISLTTLTGEYLHSQIIYLFAIFVLRENIKAKCRIYRTTKAKGTRTRNISRKTSSRRVHHGKTCFASDFCCLHCLIMWVLFLLFLISNSFLLFLNFLLQRSNAHFMQHCFLFFFSS